MTVILTVEKREFDSAGQAGYRFSLHRDRKEEQACEEPDQDRQRHKETPESAVGFLLLLAALPPPAGGGRRLGLWHRHVDRAPQQVRALIPGLLVYRPDKGNDKDLPAQVQHLPPLTVGSDS